MLLGKKKRASFFQVVASGSDAQRVWADPANRMVWENGA
jgi:hypothetical protein